MKIKIETRKDLIVGDITINMDELESWLEMLQQGNAEAVQDEEMVQTVVNLFDELEWHATNKSGHSGASDFEANSGGYGTEQLIRQGR